MAGVGTRFIFAIRSFFSILIQGDIAQDILRELGITSGAPASVAAPITPAAPAGPAEKTPADFDRAVQVLALLQRDGRLVDFLSEDITPYPDAQLGAAVRVIHDNCRQALDRYIKLEPVIASEEDQPVTVPAGFDPASIKLIGNVVGAPPMRGLLRHRGWRIQQVSLPALPQASARSIVAPAEVEIS